MNIRRMAVSTALVGSLAAAGAALAAPSPQQLLDQMGARFSKINDYEVVVDGSTRESGKMKSQRYRFAFKKPGMVRLHTLSGENKDGELVVRSDGKIRGRKNSGLIKVFAISMSRSDDRLKDDEGVGVWEMDYGSLINRLKTKLQAPGNHASVSEANGGFVLELHYGSGILNGSVDHYWIDGQSMWLTKMDRSKGGQLQVQLSYSGLKQNPGFSNSYFDF